MVQIHHAALIINRILGALILALIRALVVLVTAVMAVLPKTFVMVRASA